LWERDVLGAGLRVEHLPDVVGAVCGETERLAAVVRVDALGHEEPVELKHVTRGVIIVVGLNQAPISRKRSSRYWWVKSLITKLLISDLTHHQRDYLFREIGARLLVV